MKYRKPESGNRLIHNDSAPEKTGEEQEIAPVFRLLFSYFRPVFRHR